MTHEEYLERRKLLDELNKRIDDAPMEYKPVFAGITKLHDAVRRYERVHGHSGS